jgi:hypothetical protein
MKQILRSDLCHLYHQLVGIYNRDEKYLLHGTNWVFLDKAVCAYVIKGLNSNTFRRACYRKYAKIFLL